MISTGLYSGVLKDFTPHEIIEMCVHSHIRRIEWDSAHVPCDNLSLIDEIEKQCRLNLILPIAYNPNITITGKEDIFDVFSVSCECAKRLRAPAINVCVGAIGDSEEDYKVLVSQMKALCEIANTLIVNIIPNQDSVISSATKALKFLADVYKTNLKLYWMPNISKDKDENKAVIQEIIKYTTNIYISNRSSDDVVLPLKDAKDLWREYGRIIAKDHSRHHLFLLSGLPEIDSENLTREFASLRYILAKV